MNPSPRALILSLMLGAESRGDGVLGARELLAACALFGVPESTVRVTLTRAVAGGLMRVPRRGSYALGPSARALADEVHRWRRTASLMTPWAGDWIAVHVGATGRSDRVALRARERAFGLLGMAEFERGLHLRPNNLCGGAGSLRQRLQALVPAGTDIGTVFLLQDLSDTDTQRAHGLWDTSALDHAYRDTTARLCAWLDDSSRLALDRAARESFTLGHDAIRQLMFDPLLPAPLIDHGTRERFMQAVVRFDDAGQAIWQRFLTAARQQDPRDRFPVTPHPLDQETAP